MSLKVSRANFLGIDPGNKGGLGVVSDEGVIIELHAMPTVGGKFSVHALAALLARLRKSCTFASLEHSQAMPDQGRTSIFNYAAAFGAIEALLVANAYRYELVRPQAWQKEMHKSVDKSLGPKERSLVIAQRVFSESFHLFTPGKCKKPQDGLIDAALLAESCRRKHLNLKEAA